MAIKDQTDNTRHRLGADKLEELRFDPIDRLVEQLAFIQTLLMKELGPDMDMKKARGTAVNNFVNSQIKILETLLPYGYGKVPSVKEEETQTVAVEPIEVVLTFDAKTNPPGESS